MCRAHAMMVVLLSVLGFTFQAGMTGVRAQVTKDAKPEKGATKGTMEKGVKGNAFGTKNWKPIPPMKKYAKPKPTVAMPAVAAPPPPPSAPPLPFTYIGRMVDGKITTVFLAQQQRNLAVKEGDTIDNTYRVDKIAETSLTLTYIPLKMQQQLSLGGPR